MAKKVTKKRTSTKKVSKKRIKNTSLNKPREDNSTGIMLLAGVGLILLIYFGSNVGVDVNIDLKTSNNTEMTDGAITISGKTYSSRSEAKEKLTGMPQSQLTDDEITFVEGYTE